MIRKATLLFFICISTASYGQKTLDLLLQQFNDRSVPYVSVEELRMMQSEGNVAICDSREPSEYAVSRIPGAVFVGYDSFEESVAAKLLPDLDQPIVVYCSLGIRSEDIGAKLKKMGYTNVQNLYGGIFEWKNHGYSVIDSKDEETEKVHAYSRFWGRWLKKGEKVYD